MSAAVIDLAMRRQQMENQKAAKMLGISESYMSRIRSGKREMPCYLKPKASKCLGCPELLEEALLECPVMAAMRKEAA